MYKIGLKIEGCVILRGRPINTVKDLFGQDMDENEHNFDYETAKLICEAIKTQIEDVNNYGEEILIKEGHIDNY